MKTYNNNECTHKSCGAAGAALGLIAGIIVGVVHYFGYLAFAVTALWISLGLGVIMLFYVMAASFLRFRENHFEFRYCLFKHLKCLFTGSIGAIIAASAGLAVALAGFPIFSAIIMGLTIFFVIFAVVALALFIKCAAVSLMTE